MSIGYSLAVQWLGFRAFTAEGLGSVPGRGTKMPQASLHGQEEKKIWSLIATTCQALNETDTNPVHMEGLVCGQWHIDLPLLHSALLR